MSNFEKANDFFGNVKALSVEENGTYKAPDGSTYESVTVEVPPVDAGTLEVTENGTYEAEDGTAYSKVIVAVPEPTPDPDPDPETT